MNLTCINFVKLIRTSLVFSSMFVASYGAMADNLPQLSPIEEQQYIDNCVALAGNRFGVIWEKYSEARIIPKDLRSSGLSLYVSANLSRVVSDNNAGWSVNTEEYVTTEAYCLYSDQARHKITSPKLIGFSDNKAAECLNGFDCIVIPKILQLYFLENNSWRLLPHRADCSNSLVRNGYFLRGGDCYAEQSVFEHLAYELHLLNTINGIE